MMMATAGAGGVVAPLTHDKKRPMPRATLLVIGGSVLVHAAVFAWLYSHNYIGPAVPDVVEPPHRDVFLWTPPEPEPQTPQEATERPATPIHNPPTRIETPLEPTPFPPPDPTATTSTDNGPIIVTSTTQGVEGGTATVPTPPAPPSVIRNPAWVQRPTAAQMERAYPTRAAERGVGGSATLSCVVTASGSVTNCSIQSETPASMGFGRAAVQLSQFFRISPRTVDGAPVEGARVTIPLTFGLGD